MLGVWSAGRAVSEMILTDTVTFSSLFLSLIHFPILSWFLLYVCLCRLERTISSETCTRTSGCLPLYVSHASIFNNPFKSLVYSWDNYHAGRIVIEREGNYHSTPLYSRLLLLLRPFIIPPITLSVRVFYASMTSGLIYSVITMPLETAKNRMAFQKADPVTGTRHFVLSFHSLHCWIENISFVMWCI